jgi:hypothetical protein
MLVMNVIDDQDDQATLMMKKKLLWYHANCENCGDYGGFSKGECILKILARECAGRWTAGPALSPQPFVCNTS